MKYRNKNSGAVIEINSKLIDKDWEPIEAPAPVAKPAPKKKSTKKE